MYNVRDFTYGLELEYADVLVGSSLPEGCHWNDKDYSIVNSSGIANDPKGELWPFGGEINTRPTNTVNEQVEVVKDINGMLTPDPVVNYKCNLHVHIGVPGLERDLGGCKQLLSYIAHYAEEAMAIVDPLPPVGYVFDTEEEYAGAVARRKRNLVSHQQMIPEARLQEALGARTMQEFFNGHAPASKNGNRLWFIAPRPGINLRQLQETRTVEFRHFFQTLNLHEIWSCLVWCREFVNLALTSGKSPLTTLDKYQLHFPANYNTSLAMLYDHQLHTMFKHTNLHDNSREVVRSRLNDMTKVLFVCTGNINRSPAAHTILRSMLLGSTAVAVDSAGLSDYNAGKLTRRRMRDVLENKGYAYYPIWSKQVTREMIDSYDLIIYMSDVHERRLTERFGTSSKYMPITEWSSGDVDKIPDPQSGSVEDYRYVVGLLEDCCYNLVEELV